MEENTNVVPSGTEVAILKGEIKYIKLCEKECKNDKGETYTRRFFIGNIATETEVIEFSCSFGVLEAPMKAKALRLINRVYEEFGAKDVNHLLKWATVRFHFDKEDEYENIIFDSIVLDDEAMEVYTDELKNL